jgi:hypothetical protein
MGTVRYGLSRSFILKFLLLYGLWLDRYLVVKELLSSADTIPFNYSTLSLTRLASMIAGPFWNMLNFLL